jgi:hypothetical protein
MAASWDASSRPSPWRPHAPAKNDGGRGHVVRVAQLWNVTVAAHVPVVQPEPSSVRSW